MKTSEFYKLTNFEDEVECLKQIDFHLMELPTIIAEYEEKLEEFKIIYEQKSVLFRKKKRLLKLKEYKKFRESQSTKVVK